MKYIVMDERDGDLFTSEFNTAEDAIRKADLEWTHLTEKEKRNRSAFYILASVNPDEDAMDHYDGDLVKDYKEEYHDK